MTAVAAASFHCKRGYLTLFRACSQRPSLVLGFYKPKLCPCSHPDSATTTDSSCPSTQETLETPKAPIHLSLIPPHFLSICEAKEHAWVSMCGWASCGFWFCYIPTFSTPGLEPRASHCHTASMMAILSVDRTEKCIGQHSIHRVYL